MSDAAGDFTGLMVEDVAFAAKRVGENKLFTDGNNVQGGCHRIGPPHQRTVLRIQAPYETVIGAFFGAIVATNEDPPITRTQRAFGRHVIIGRQPDDITGRGIKTGSQTVIFDRQPTSPGGKLSA